jgi:hypothetical protein
MLTLDECCGHRPAEYPNTDVASDPELSQLFVQVANDPLCEWELFQCQQCGQLWRFYSINRGYMDEPLVIKDGLDDVPQDEFAPSLPVDTRSDRLPIGDTVGVVGLILGTLGLVAGLVRLPDDLEGSEARCAFVLGHLAAGVGMAVLLLILLIARRKWKADSR